MKDRLQTAAVAMPLVLGAVFCAKHLPLCLVAVLAYAIGWLEFCKLCSARRGVPSVGLAAGGGLVVSGWFVPSLCLPGWALGGLGLLLTAVGSWAAWSAAKNRGSRLLALVACLWIASPLACVVAIHCRASEGPIGAWWNLHTALLMVLFPLWAGDSAAIFVGRALGRKLLAPSISPKKTVEGAVGNLLACMLLGWATSVWLPTSPWLGLGAGLACGVLGQAGDLFESALKRLVGVKDSGNLLPGHGGMLDRIDSLLFSAPAVLLLLACYS